mmetsp:Transcript_5423/g.17077  ORF Transcript_5423/g.17077 Transcript_5423/m.17077 type:complete len:222 (-) Transcript_5423:156-821(-)
MARRASTTLTNGSWKRTPKKRVSDATAAICGADHVASSNAVRVRAQRRRHREHEDSEGGTSSDAGGLCGDDSSGAVRGGFKVERCFVAAESSSGETSPAEALRGQWNARNGAYKHNGRQRSGNTHATGSNSASTQPPHTRASHVPLSTARHHPVSVVRRKHAPRNGRHSANSNDAANTRVFSRRAQYRTNSGRHRITTATLSTSTGTRMAATVRTTELLNS